MKKVFQLKAPGKVDQRVVEAVKNDVRKYVKRERRKPLPLGFTEWTFACKAGASREAAPACALAEIGRIIDGVVAAEGAEVYIEILAVAGYRTPPITAVTPGGETPAPLPDA